MLMTSTWKSTCHIAWNTLLTCASMPSFFLHSLHHHLFVFGPSIFLGQAQQSVPVLLQMFVPWCLSSGSAAKPFQRWLHISFPRAPRTPCAVREPSNLFQLSEAVGHVNSVHTLILPLVSTKSSSLFWAFLAALLPRRFSFLCCVILLHGKLLSRRSTQAPCCSPLVHSSLGALTVSTCHLIQSSRFPACAFDLDELLWA